MPTPSQVTDNPYIGIGLYSIPEAARLLKTPSRTLYNWVKGYASPGERGVVAPMLVQDFPELTAEGILTFLDLVEIHMVRLFRQHGVRMSTIKSAAVRLADKYGTNHPLAVKGLETDGKRIFDADARSSARLVEELGAYQYVIEEAAKPFFKQLVYKDDLACCMWPIGEGRVVLDPRRNFGKPIVHHGGVPTYPLYQMRRAGQSPEVIARWYRIPVKSVNDAVDYENQLAA